MLFIEPMYLVNDGIYKISDLRTLVRQILAPKAIEGRRTFAMLVLRMQHLHHAECLRRLWCVPLNCTDRHRRFAGIATRYSLDPGGSQLNTDY